MNYTTREFPFTVKGNQLLLIDPCKIDEEEKHVQGVKLNLSQEQIKVVVSLTPLESIRELLVVLDEGNVSSWTEIGKINVDSGQISLINAADVSSWRKHNEEQHAYYWRVTNENARVHFSNFVLGEIQISSVYVGDWSWPLMGGYNEEGDLIQLSVAVEPVDYANRLDYKKELIALNLEYEKVDKHIVYRYTDFNNPDILDRMCQEKEFSTLDAALQHAYEAKKADVDGYYITGIQVNEVFIPANALSGYWVRRNWDMKEINQRDWEKIREAQRKAIEKQNSSAKN